MLNYEIKQNSFKLRITGDGPAFSARCIDLNTIAPDIKTDVWGFLLPKNKVFSGKTETLPGGYSGFLHRFTPRQKNQWLNCILSRSEFDSNPRSLNSAASIIWRTISQWRPRPGLCLSVGDVCCPRKRTGADKGRLVLDHIIF